MIPAARGLIDFGFMIYDSGRTGLARQLPPLTPPCTGGGWHRGVFGWSSLGPWKGGGWHGGVFGWSSLGPWEGGGGAVLLHRGAFSR